MFLDVGYLVPCLIIAVRWISRHWGDGGRIIDLFTASMSAMRCGFTSSYLPFVVKYFAIVGMSADFTQDKQKNEINVIFQGVDIVSVKQYPLCSSSILTTAWCQRRVTSITLYTDGGSNRMKGPRTSWNERKYLTVYLAFS